MLKQTNFHTQIRYGTVALPKMYAMRMQTRIFIQTSKIPFGPKSNIIIYLFYLDVKLQISPQFFIKLPISPQIFIKLPFSPQDVEKI